MRAPVLITGPVESPVSLPDVKLHLRVDHDDEDGLIQAYIDAAVAHLDGWTGVLGRCLVSQTWRQDFDRFASCLRLPLWPIREIRSITWRNEQGQIATISGGDYALKADALGGYVRFVDGYAYPSGLYQSDAVAVTFTAGTDPAVVPAALKAAIMLLVGHWYQNREAVAENSLVELPMAVNALIAPFRRVGI